MNAKAGSRAARMSSEDRRAQIMDIACEVFAGKGFRGTTTRELAAAAGVTEPVLYEHFRTKRDLYSAIIETKAREGIEVLSALSERFAEANDDFGFFTALGDSIVGWYTEDKSFIRLLLFSNLEGHELKDLFHHRSRDCFEIIASYIARRKGEGAFKDSVDPALAACAFFGMVAHHALHAVVFEVTTIPKPPNEVIRDMVEIFLTGMCEQEQPQ